jgi:hypothetical protein
LGFFSYYKYILGQREANKIICIKGGPGTGKSTFMKKIAERFAKVGENIDYLHCSADEESLDGIILVDRKVAIIDGTSPHVTDPITPGAVDKIINFGEFWSEEGISINREEIMDLNEETSKWYRIAYNYLNAAKSVYRSLESIYINAVQDCEIYGLVADIIKKEFGNLEISLTPGKKKKFFASAITGSGIVNYLGSLLGNMDKIYLLNSPIGYSNSSFMEIISEGAIYRGLDTELFYCPMCPEEKIEHIIIPKIKTAFITVNNYHDIEPWEIASDNEDDLDERKQEIILIDAGDYMDTVEIERNGDIIGALEEEYEILLNKGINQLSKARDKHMLVEKMYMPNMNFMDLSKLIADLTEELMNI